MALERKDNIGDTTTSTGTGTINLAAVAQSGARIFAGNVTSGATVRYDIRSADNTEWEIGEGVFTDGAPDTLTRVTIYASSNAGALVSFSAGTKNVSLVLTAADIGTNSFIIGETPSGALDGSDTTYTLANTPITGSLVVYLNGQRLTLTEDYMLATNVITFGTAPVSGDIIRADYLLAGATSGNADTLDNANLSTDGTLASNSDGLIPTEKAVKTYVDGQIDAWDGWQDAGESWTYASSTTLTISGDKTGKYANGTKVKLTNNGSTKYFYVVSSSYSSPNTTVSLTGETDLANAAITAPYYSYSDNPQGFKRAENYYKARAYRSTTQAINDITFTKVQFDGESYDVNSNFDSSTNYRYTAPISGYYNVFSRIFFNVATTNRAIVALYKNASVVSRGSDIYTGQYQGCVISDTVYLAKGDYVEIYAYRDGTGTENLFGEATGSQTFFSVSFQGI